MKLIIHYDVGGKSYFAPIDATDCSIVLHYGDLKVIIKKGIKMGIKAKADKITGYIRDYGISYAAKKVYYRYKVKYKLGRKYCPFEISDAQRKSEQQYKPAQKIKVSIVVPLYNTPENFLKEMLDSVEAQTYTDWELCLADASDEKNGQVKKTVEQYQAKDKRIKYKKLSKNEGISENTNRALEMAAGDYIGLMDHDDLLHPSVLYNVVKTIEEKKADFIYTDELSFVGTTDRVQSIHFKPDFSWETFRNNNFICHFTAFKRSLLKETGGFRKEFDGAQDYDMFLRLLEKAKRVCHIQKVLYYWRLHAGSVASGVGAKPYTVESGRKALEEHLHRENIIGKAYSSELYGPFYTVDYHISKNDKNLVVVESKQARKFAIQEINKSDLKYDIVVADEFKESQVSSYDNVIFVADRYERYEDSDRENVGKIDKGVFEEVLQCLQPSENVASGATVYYKKKVYQSGYCYDKGLKNFIMPLYRGVPVKDPAYMNRLKFRQNVSLLGKGVFAIKSGTLLQYLQKSENKEDLFSNEFYFALCLYIKGKAEKCVVSPLVPLKICSKVKNTSITKDFIEIRQKDLTYNANMNLFGKYYFLWK